MTTQPAANGIIMPANETPPPMTITTHVVDAFTSNANALSALFDFSTEKHHRLSHGNRRATMLSDYKATLAAMRNMPPEALGDVTIPIITGFFEYFEQSVTSVGGQKKMAAFDSNIALAIQDAAQHIMQNMNAQMQARQELEKNLRGGLVA